MFYFLRRSCNETKKWEYILTTLKYLICLILRVLLFFAAYIMLKCSKLFETLSEYLKTNINTEDLFETPDENKLVVKNIFKCILTANKY